MSTSITIPAEALMLAPPALLLTGGLIVAVALRGFLTTGIEVARLNAANDAKTARWLWRNGYRKTPHAGPDLTAEPAPLALSDRSHADEQADHTDTDRPRWWATVAAFVVLAPVAFARRQLPVLAEWARERFKTNAQRDAEYRQALEPFEQFRIDDSLRGRTEVPIEPATELEAAAEVPTPIEPEPVRIVRVNHRYRRPGDTGLFPLVKVVGDKAAGRHRKEPEPEMPAINQTIPAQRTDGDL